MTHAHIRRHCALNSTLGDLLQQAMERLSLSARAYDRILKVARTIADLATTPARSHPIPQRGLECAVLNDRGSAMVTATMAGAPVAPQTTWRI
jgi:predicted ATPase with chaperone activity